MLTDWELVGDKKECAGAEIFQNNFPSIAECAASCHGKASMFAFGTNDYGKKRCYIDGCGCLCETNATIDGMCDQEKHDGYRLYKYAGKSNHFCNIFTIIIIIIVIFT